MEFWQNDADGELLGEKRVPISLRPPQIGYGMTGFEAGASAVSSHRQIARTIARPLVLFVKIIV